MQDTNGIPLRTPFDIILLVIATPVAIDLIPLPFSLSSTDSVGSKHGFALNDLLKAAWVYRFSLSSRASHSRRVHHMDGLRLLIMRGWGSGEGKELLPG
jgi:hypothetical protein